MTKVSTTFNFYSLFLITLAAIVAQSNAQSGGGFEITEAVIAPSGGSATAGNQQIDATGGQPVAGGASAAGPFSVTSGFWNFTPLGPTAAPASISGRVISPSGIGVFNAVLYLHTQDGSLLMARSSPLGHYRFDGIAVGQSVFITVESKQYVFSPRVVMVNEEITELDFIAES